jgi:hypothetical protein
LTAYTGISTTPSSITAIGSHVLGRTIDDHACGTTAASTATFYGARYSPGTIRAVVSVISMTGSTNTYGTKTFAVGTAITTEATLP